MFWLLTALYAGTALLLWLELRGNPHTHARSGPHASIAEAFRRMAALTRLPWVRVVLATVCIEGGLFYGALAFVALDLHLRHGLGLGAAGAMVAGRAPSGSSNVRTSGASEISFSSRLRRCTSAWGVPAGASTPTQISMA